MTLFVNEVWVDKKPISLTLRKNQQKIKALLNGTVVVNVEQWTKKFKSLCCLEVKAVEYFELLGTRNREVNGVTQRISSCQ